MPSNIPINGDDAPWKREVDIVLTKLQSQIDQLTSRVKYLESRSK